MKIGFTIARILLGLIFFILGLNGFLFFIPPPAVIPGAAGQFNAALMSSHYMWFTSGAQVVAGAMLLTNQYAPFAIVVLAAILSNILVFHITMWPATIVPGLVATVLWFIVAWPMRAHFAPIFARRAQMESK